MRGFFLHICALAALGLILNGCATRIGPAASAGANAQSDAPKPGAVLVWNQPSPISQDQLAQALASARVVMVGETHDHPGHHEAQLNILKLMIKQGPAPVVGIEWLDHGAQPACDALASGSITVDEFAWLADWNNRWGYTLDLYRPILEYVREHGLKL